MSQFTCSKCGGTMRLRGRGEVFYDITMECDRSAAILSSAIEREVVLDDLFGEHDMYMLCSACGEKHPHPEGVTFDLDGAYMMVEDDPALNAAFPEEIQHQLIADQLQDVSITCPADDSHTPFTVIFLLNWMAEFDIFMDPEGSFTVQVHKTAQLPFKAALPLNTVKCFCTHCNVTPKLKGLDDISRISDILQKTLSFK